MSSPVVEKQALLDLEWVLTSPSLVDDPKAIGVVDFAPDSVDLDHLNAFVAERPQHRVGKYFETLLEYWLAHVRDVDLIDVGRQLRDGQGRTVGELDFLFRDEQNRYCHCEASVKFFLHHPRSGTSHYPGPAARDNFERKATKLFERQLPLSIDHVPEVEDRLGFVRGYIFYELGSDGPQGRPPRLAEDHLRGAWVRATNASDLERFEGAQFHIVSKPHWLAPIADAEGRPFAAFADQLTSHFAGPAYPMMVSVVGAEAQEVARCCVVSEEWPDDANRWR